MKSESGLNDIAKSKGFHVHAANSRIFIFDELKRQVIAKALGQEIEDMVLHKDESIMRRHFFQIRVEKNKGKEIKMVYDKRVIVIPDSEHLHMIDTLPYGHEKLQFVETL